MTDDKEIFSFDEMIDDLEGFSREVRKMWVSTEFNAAMRSLSRILKRAGYPRTTPKVQPINRPRKPKRIKQPPRYPRRCRPRPRETPGVNPMQSRECKP
jgi:hypothetical protein